MPSLALSRVHIDHTGPYPTTFAKNTHAFVVVDRLTKFTFIEAVRDTSAKHSIAALQKFMLDWGVPEVITSDRGSAFTSAEFSKFLSKLSVKHVLNCPRRPCGNGQVERTNAVITPLLAKLLHQGKPGTWDRLIKKVQLLLNTSVNRSTGETPIRLLCGFNLEIPDRFLSAVAHPSTQTVEDPEKLRRAARDRLQKAFGEVKKHYDKRHVAAERLREGDIVWFSASPRKADGTSRKLDPLFRGPLMVTRALEHDTYAVVALDDQNPYSTIAHVGQLRLYGHGAEQLPEKTPEQAERSSRQVGELSFNESLLGHRGSTLTDILAGESGSDEFEDSVMDPTPAQPGSKMITDGSDSPIAQIIPEEATLDSTQQELAPTAEHVPVLEIADPPERASLCHERSLGDVAD